MTQARAYVQQSLSPSKVILSALFSQAEECDSFHTNGRSFELHKSRSRERFKKRIESSVASETVLSHLLCHHTVTI